MTTIAALAEKIEMLRAIEAERRFGNVITPGVRREPIPELPAGTIEVFGLYERLEGSHMLFKPHRYTRSPEAWRARGTDEFPLGENLRVGAELYTMPEYLPGETDDAAGYGGASVSMWVDGGQIFYIDSENYIGAYDDPDPSDLPVVTFAPDLATFLDRYVLGPEYPRLVDTVIGPGTSQERHPKTGEPFDTWQRLLIAAGLVEA